jgi:hypothetical protein
MGFIHEGHVDAPWTATEPQRKWDPPENCWGCHR